jgi:F-type H+-transporting ATPase subunit epsilon
MSDSLRLEIVTPRRLLVQTDVAEVRLPGVLGELGVLPGHTPLLTALDVGRLSYTEGGREKKLAVANGFAEVLPDRVTVLAKLAETPEEIDAAQAGADRDAAVEAMKTATAEDLETITGELKLAETRIDVTH